MREIETHKAAAERRADARLLTILRVGKLITDRVEELCLIRNIAAGGAMIEARSPLKARQRVRIELRRDHPFWGTVLWVTPSIAGIGFDERADIADLLTRDDHRREHPRLNIPANARLIAGGRTRHVAVHDVSQKGLGIGTDEIFADGAEVLIALDGLDPVQGIVRWCRDGMAGVEFARPIQLGVLSEWLQKTFGGCSIERSFAGDATTPRTEDDDEEMGRLLQLI